MTTPTIRYDQESDTLYISFIPGRHATGIELNDHILLRIDKSKGQAVGLTLLDYSVLAQYTETGPRSFPLTGLHELSPELRDVVVQIILRPPVSDFLRLSTYTPTIADALPIATILPVQAPEQNA